MEKRDSIMTPAPRISEGGCSFLLSSLSAEAEHPKEKLENPTGIDAKPHRNIHFVLHGESP